MNLFQITTIILMLLTLYRLILTFKKGESIKPLSLLIWASIWVIGIFIILFPKSTVYISQLLGIARGVDIAVYSSILLLYYFIYKLLIEITRLEKKIKDLNQKLSLEKFLKEQNEK